MDRDNIFDQNFLKIKDKLNRDQIKLWLPPFFNENEGKNDEALKNLANAVSQDLSISNNICLQHLEQLQAKALNNLKERNNFRETGQASLKVRVPNDQGGSIVTVSIELSQTGLALKEEISQAISVPIGRLKVIFKGQFLRDKDTLQSQGVKHGLHMMAVVLQDNSEGIVPQAENCMKKLNSTREDIELLLESKHFQITDQSGKPLLLPLEEKKSLLKAMTLHEKGRVALKNEDFAFALVLLLEAEKEFCQGNSSLLKSVDNYGLLSLDIVWCYLNLQSVTQLPDAEERLLQCEENFIQSYGANLERLTALKGFTGNEAALFMRLHLLQAIVLYHQNKFNEAKSLFQKAEEELNKLKVDDGQLSQLIELGYETTEARLALRASRGDINTAIAIIDNKRIERKRIEEIEEQEIRLSRKRKILGKCLNNEWVDPELHSTLMSMGFNFEVAQWALAQSNNNINDSINLINEKRGLLLSDQVNDKEYENFTADSLQQVIDMGFEPIMAKRALKKNNGNFQQAIEDLFANDGFLPPLKSSSDSSSSDEINDTSGPSTSELRKKQKEAFTRISEGLSLNEDDHLDLNLIPETEFLQKYKELMKKE